MKLEPVSSEEIQSFHNASLEILASTGVVFESQSALEIFKSAGGLVDFDQKRVRIPEELVKKALQTTSNHFRLWDRDGNEQIDLMDGQIRGHNVGGCVKIFDNDIGRAREATRKDLERLTHLLDGLANIHVCRPVVYPKDFPVTMWDIYTAATMLQYTTKPYGVTAYSIKNLSYILELTSVISGSLENLLQKPFIWGSVCPHSPLNYPESTTNILIKYAEIGLPVAIAPCPVAGGSSPVTLAGTIAQLNAEFLAGLVLAQIIRPGIDVKYTGRPMPMNMRTGNATFGAIEMGIMSAVLVQLSNLYKVCSDSYGLGTRSRNLDEQSAYEKALNGLLVALAGADLVAAAGLLDDALTSSAEQLVIDNEILGMIFRAVRGVDLTTESLAVDLVNKMGPGGHFLVDPHTVSYMRSEHFQPKLVDYTSNLEDTPGVHSYMNIVQDRVNDILESHEPKLLNKETVDEINNIVGQATKELDADL